MRKVLLAFLLLGLISCTFAEQNYDGFWSDETRHSPTNPGNFLSIAKLSDGRYFILSCVTNVRNDPIWNSSIGSIKKNTLYAMFNDKEWRITYGVDKKNIEYLYMESVDNPDFSIGFGRVAEQPIKKLEGTVRKEAFTKD